MQMQVHQWVSAAKENIFVVEDGLKGLTAEKEKVSAFIEDDEGILIHPQLHEFFEITAQAVL